MTRVGAALVLLATSCGGATHRAMPTAKAIAPKTMRVGVHKGVVFVPSLLLQPILGAAWNVELSYFGSPADMANAIVSRRHVLPASTQRFATTDSRLTTRDSR